MGCGHARPMGRQTGARVPVWLAGPVTTATPYEQRLVRLCIGMAVCVHECVAVW